MSDYILVTNFWNEAGSLRPLIEMIGKQIKKPRDWFFIDDGSPEDAGDEVCSEIMRAGDEFGIKVHYTYAYPMKSIGNKFTIGKAWNIMIPFIKELKADYLGVIDVDMLNMPINYWYYLVNYLDQYSDLGVVAGTVIGERRVSHMPMGGGKLIRWDIVERIEEFWDLAPDTFFNIKSLAMGYHNDVLDIPIDAKKSTPRGGRDLGHRLHYCGNSILTALFKSIRLRDLNVLIGFFRSRGKEQCDDPDVRYYYSKRRILKSLFRRRIW